MHSTCKGFTRDLTLKTAEAFNKISTAAEAEGLRFGYHCHGYEFVPSPEGTLFETLAGYVSSRNASCFRSMCSTPITVEPIRRA